MQSKIIGIICSVIMLVAGLWYVVRFDQPQNGGVIVVLAALSLLFFLVAKPRGFKA